MSVALDVEAFAPHYGSCAATAAPAAPRPRPPGAVRRAGALALVAVLGFVGGRSLDFASSHLVASDAMMAGSTLTARVSDAAAPPATLAAPFGAATPAPFPSLDSVTGLINSVDVSTLPIDTATLLPVAAAAGATALLAALAGRLARRRPPPPWAGEAEGVVPGQPARAARYSWGLWPSLPLQPYGRKVTLETEVVRGAVWTHDQVQGTVNVMVPVRQTVVCLRDGGLFVHNPVAPTPELIAMMRRLEDQYGPVKHIVLGSLALEHKVPAGPFARRFRQAQVWVMPGQYSFPLNLPNSFLGFGRTRTLPEDPQDTPFGAEIDYAIFGPAKFPSIGAFGETAFYHKATRTLLVTDAIVRVDDEPPAIVTEDPRALLFHARDAITEEVVNDEATRRRGWRRIVQFGLNFLPSALDVVPAGEAIADVGRRPASMAGLGGVPFGLTPWRWARDDRPSFRALQGGLLVAPILRELIFNRFPEETLEWADRVARWPFRRIIPCHLANDLQAGPQEFRDAFRFLEKSPIPPLPIVGRRPAPLPQDGKLLQGLNESLVSAGILPPPAPKP